MPAKSGARANGSKGQSRPGILKEGSMASNSKPVEKPKDSTAKPDASPSKPNSQKHAQKSHEDAGQSDDRPKPPPATGLSDTVTGEATVNRKKQKRRIKEAAKRAAEQQSSGATKQGDPNQPSGHVNGYGYNPSDYEDADQYDADDADDVYYSDEAANHHFPIGYSLREMNGGTAPTAKSKKRKNKKTTLTDTDGQAPDSAPDSVTDRPVSSQKTPKRSKDRIWNTSTAEERERIKQFWLSLGEEDRRSLVKVEKEAVLRKMKEQQKHSCSCTVCGRKRTAIEEELEVLYDAYYEELEQYANDQQIVVEDGGPMLPSSRLYPHPMSRHPPNRHPRAYTQQASRARIEEVGEDDDPVTAEEGEEAEEAEGEEQGGGHARDDHVGDDVIEHPNFEQEPSPAAAEFFNFGNSLTVQGGILTVADDLLKNDGKKFIEMMEQLAERRMQREEDAQSAASGLPMQHNHPGTLSDDMDDEEDDDVDDYDSQEDEQFEEDDLEELTEDQRMEEGRRMFQIFAARMFEQRVLTAYREKVAYERQQRLLEELDDESRVDAQKEAKKAKEAAKKKEKKRQQKQAKDEEKARREAEKAAEEAAAKELEEKKAEEQRLKKEEQRKKREAEKKALEEEKTRKEAEKLKRLQEARELQAEQERKQREQKEREKKKRDDAKKKEREEREAKEKEAKEKKEREIAERLEREAKANTATAVKVQAKKGDSSPAKAITTAMPKRLSPANPAVTHISTAGLQPPLSTSSHTSPHLPIATPVIPKAPTPVRPRQPSFDGFRTTSPKSALPAMSSTTSPRSSIKAFTSASTGFASSNTHPTPPQQNPGQSSYSPKTDSPGSATRPPGFSGIPISQHPVFEPALGPSVSETITPFALSTQANQAHPGRVSQFAHTSSNVGPFAPNPIDGTHFLHNRGKMEPPPQPTPVARLPLTTFGEIGQPSYPSNNTTSQTHSRNTSTSSNVAAQAQPIARPAPIKRPSSTTPQPGGVDDLTNHLGSKALLDDDDDFPMTSPIEEARRVAAVAAVIGGNRRAPFGGPPGFPDPIGTTRHDLSGRNMNTGPNTSWLPHQSSFGSSTNTWPVGGFGRSGNPKGFGSLATASHESTTGRAMVIRSLIATACQKLSARKGFSPNTGWHYPEEIHQEVQHSRPQQSAPVTLSEVLDLFDTTGNSQNGGGSFEVCSDQRGTHVRFNQERSAPPNYDPGEIGSPAVTASSIFRPFQPASGFPHSTGF